LRKQPCRCTVLLYFLFPFFLLLSSLSYAVSESPFSKENGFLGEIPTSYIGRFRPFNVYARLWFYEFYHHQQIKKTDKILYNIHSPEEFLWRMHFYGHQYFDGFPLFWVTHAEVKQLLNLDQKKENFSFNQLHSSLFESETGLNVAKFLASYHFLKNYQEEHAHSLTEKRELSHLSPGLWITFQANDVVVVSSPKGKMWEHLKPGMILLSNGRQSAKDFLRANKKICEEIIALVNKLDRVSKMKGSQYLSNNLKKTLLNLKAQGKSKKEIASALEAEFPISKQLHEGDGSFQMLSDRNGNGDWLSLSALKTQIYNINADKLLPIRNFTAYNDELFQQIRTSYLNLEKTFLDSKGLPEITLQIKNLNELLAKGYKSLEGIQYKEAAGKGLYYPSISQLRAESFYYRTPLIELSILFYTLTVGTFVLAFSLQRPKLNLLAFGLLLSAFLLHTVAIGLRCFILSRAPVSNMFETVIYVPWIAVLASLILRIFVKNNSALIASSLVSLVLLLLVKITNMNSNLENVQAVLDSQYWLLIHVLMVVGSYGAFALSGVLSHLYLLSLCRNKKETSYGKFIAQFNLHSIYLGLALLIPGTILGGVWAAESWGRFWDWDPKESWAFISICVYLIWIHAYTFQHIENVGLAVGSIIGLQAISFTWYGVNYILGTGLHSYGFGSGGEEYYFLFILSEAFFLTGIFLFKKQFTFSKNNY
jgi:ABC-type transport system involved in cytochrome c biogenesis permease subunit